MSASASALKNCPLFKGFTDTGVQIIASIGTERAFPKGVPLFVESMLGDSLFVLVDGKVAVSTKDPSGREIAIGELSAPDSVGELALIQQSQRMCTVTATTGVTAIEIRSADFQKLLAQKPQACIKLLMGITTDFAQRVAENKDAFKGLLPKG